MLQPEFPIRIRGFPSKFSAPGTLVDVSFQPDGRAEKCILGLKGTEDFGAYTTELEFRIQNCRERLVWFRHWKRLSGMGLRRCAHL